MLQEATMAVDIREEDLLRSIEEVEAKIHKFRKQVRAVLEAVQTEFQQGATAKNPQPVS
jgi:prefoldin subunit 5